MGSTSVKLGVACLLLLASAEYSPFLTPHYDKPHNAKLWQRRKLECETSCATMNANVCCPKEAVCGLDHANNVACCPIGAVCTGTISSISRNEDVTQLTSNPTSQNALARTTIVATNTVPNTYYPFPIIPTTFDHSPDCTSAFSACQTEASKCVASVGGLSRGYGVTISGAGAQITQGSGPTDSIQLAQAVCTSLSQAACHGLVVEQCSATYSVGSGSFSASKSGFIAGTSSNTAVTQTPWAMRYRAAAIMMVGLVHQLY